MCPDKQAQGEWGLGFTTFYYKNFVCENLIMDYLKTLCLWTPTSALRV